MLEYLKEEANRTYTENGAVTYETTGSDCLDFYATVGAVRRESEEEIIGRFIRAYAENPDIAMKILFFGRDVRGGLGERRVFRVVMNWLAGHEPQSVKKNIEYIAEYGRFDDLLSLMGTSCEKDAVRYIRKQLEQDLTAYDEGKEVSLLAKWLPSVNASSSVTVSEGKRLARALGISEADYRKMLAKLRGRIRILENYLREKDYSFEYEKQPSKALFKYRSAFMHRDRERYEDFLEKVQRGEKELHTGTLAPYEIIAPCFRWYGVQELSEEERYSMDVTWNALEDFGGEENALVVMDGSGSMYMACNPMPITVAMSLGIYFAERNQGIFHNHFITFSENPRLVEIKGRDIAEKVRYCEQYDECSNTDLEKVFSLLLQTAVKNGLSQEEMPSTLYIVSDMEFDCIDHASVSNFERAKQMFADCGYTLPKVVFWNVASRRRQQPVTQNEQGVVLVSGCTPQMFSMVAEGAINPYAMMMETIESERYEPISA